MEFKSIELQIAIPRTQDAGKMQEQMTKQGQHFQDTLTEQQLREEIDKRMQVNDYEAVEKQIVKEEKEHQQQNDSRKSVNKDEQKEKVDLEHPYLGNKVDFTG